MGYPENKVLEAVIENHVLRTIEAYSGGVELTPSNEEIVSLNSGCIGVRGLMCQVAGTVTVTFIDGTSATVSLLAGVIYPLLVKKVTAATATGIVGLY